MHKTLSRRATKVKSKYQSEEEKRLARNARVRIRRAKIRAAKKAKRKATKKVTIAVPPAKPHVAIVVYAVSTDLLIGGEALASFASPTNIAEFVSDMQRVVHALGATVDVHDLRAPR